MNSLSIRPISTYKKEECFFYLICLTGFFILLEISFFIQCNRTYLDDFTFVSNKLSIPITILPGIFYFLMAQCLVHLMYSVLVWIISSLIINLFHLENKAIFFSILVWVIGILSACIANQYYFPNSKFSELTAIILINPTITKIALIIFLSLDIILILLAILHLILLCKSIFFILLLISAITIKIFFSFSKNPSAHLDAATLTHPNIILIGVDSLRPDFLSYFGDDHPTPFLDTFLSQALVFSEAITPLARTFPSWTSILSGLYPRQIAIRTNLAQQQYINLTHTLPAILQRNGYETIFATDETRFSNIDKNFGFDKVITPPMGLNDFLLGTFNDFPLSNLLINYAFLGRWLFPYSYANRPVYFNYDPDSFINLLSAELKTKRNKPLFLTLHFCLTHYPYLWNRLDGFKYVKPLERYIKSIRRLDQQINDFFRLLKENHCLDHAIVVLLSDHGEALELSGDRITEESLFVSAKSSTAMVPKFYPPGIDNEKINESAGHGTDVLSLTQYHTLLAFKFYGLGNWQKGLIAGVVSLLDIKPTLLDLVHLTAPISNGNSLVPVIKFKQKLQTEVHHFLESDFSPAAIRTVYPETHKVLLDGVELFKIDPVTTRLVVKDSMEKMIIHSKQYADIYQNWILALYPQNDHSHLPILVNLNTGRWTNDLQTEFALRSPAKFMLEQLKNFYGDEIKPMHFSAQNKD